MKHKCYRRSDSKGNVCEEFSFLPNKERGILF